MKTALRSLLPAAPALGVVFPAVAPALVVVGAVVAAAVVLDLLLGAPTPAPSPRGEPRRVEDAQATATSQALHGLSLGDPTEAAGTKPAPRARKARTIVEREHVRACLAAGPLRKPELVAALQELTGCVRSAAYRAATRAVGSGIATTNEAGRIALAA